MEIWNVTIEKSPVLIVGYQISAINIKEAYAKLKLPGAGKLLEFH